MIGLRRHTVQVVEHDPAWVSLFENEAHVIRHAGGPLVLDVQHIGSTAVQGLPAKPIIDIAVAIRSYGDIPELVRRLVAVGYVDRGNQGRGGGYLLVRDSEPEVRTAHLHVVELTDALWGKYITFRDILRRDAGIREAYAEVKRRLAATYPNDRKQYTACKDEFVERVLEGSPESS